MTIKQMLVIRAAGSHEMMRSDYVTHDAVCEPQAAQLYWRD